MKIDIQTLDGKKSGSLDLSKNIFGQEPRKDILHRMVRYQLAKRQSGTHQVQERGDVSKTTKRIGRQKGGGTARHGNGSVSQFRGGAKAHGPRSR
jgi:large subunit ribosomal protein L4